MKIRVIVNPAAGGGRAAKKLGRLEKLLSEHSLQFETIRTRGPAHATQLAREATNAGVDVLGVMGGDGTINEVCQAFVCPSGQPVPGPAISLIPAGTGGDYRKSWDFDAGLQAAVERLVRCSVVPADLGVVSFGPSATQHCAFANIASFGISGLIARRTQDFAKRIGGGLAFLGCTLVTALTYKCQQVALYNERDELLFEGPVFAVAFANGRYFGGGMHVAPHASPTDGQLECIVVGQLKRLDSYRLTSKLHAGTHLELPGVTLFSGKSFRAVPLAPQDNVLVETDGEVPGVLPLQARVYPGAVGLLT